MIARLQDNLANSRRSLNQRRSLSVAAVTNDLRGRTKRFPSTVMNERTNGRTNDSSDAVCLFVCFFVILLMLNRKSALQRNHIVWATIDGELKSSERVVAFERARRRQSAAVVDEFGIVGEVDEAGAEGERGATFSRVSGRTGCRWRTSDKHRDVANRDSFRRRACIRP